MHLDAAACVSAWWGEGGGVGGGGCGASVRRRVARGEETPLSYQTPTRARTNQRTPRARLFYDKVKIAFDLRYQVAWCGWHGCGRVEVAWCGVYSSGRPSIASRHYHVGTTVLSPPPSALCVCSPLPAPPPPSTPPPQPPRILTPPYSLPLALTLSRHPRPHSPAGPHPHPSLLAPDMCRFVLLVSPSRWLTWSSASQTTASTKPCLSRTR